MSKRRIYMDWASSTPVHPKAARAAYYAMEDIVGNPSSSHDEGRRASEALKDARRNIAGTLSVKPEELLFASGGTEANNIAIRGIFRALHERGVPYQKMHAVTSAAEHASVLEAFTFLEEEGVKVTYIKPSFDGLIDPDTVFDALQPETVLVSLAHVNSETGSVLSVSEISESIQRYKERGLSAFLDIVPEFRFPAFHTDAAQSPLYLEVGPHVLKADLVSYDAQKMMGPKGVGVLYRDFSVPLAPIMGGGTQERGIRPGTENIPAIVAAAVAFQLAKEGRREREARVRELRDRLINMVQKTIPEAKLIGHPKRRIANNALFAISGADGEYLTVLMDSEGVAVSPRSACGGTGGGHSHVVEILTGDMALARGTVRFSLGPLTEAGDITEAVVAFRRSVDITTKST